MPTLLLPGITAEKTKEDIEAKIRIASGIAVEATITGTRHVENIDLKPLSELPELRILHISDTYLLGSLDLSPLSSLTELREVHITANSSLTTLDLKPLSILFKLEEIHLNRNVSLIDLDLTPLSAMMHFRKLTIDRNLSLQNLDLAPLGSLLGLKELSISHNMSLENLDLNPIGGLIKLKTLIISGNTSLRSIDLSSLSNLIGLEQLNLSLNTGLMNLDLTPLGSLRNVREIYVSGNKRLTALDLSPLVSLRELQKLGLQENTGLTWLDVTPLECLSNAPIALKETASLKKVVSFLSPENMGFRLYSSRGSRFLSKLPIMFSFTPLASFEYIVKLRPIVEEKEEPWKMHHLIQSALKLLDLDWLGMLDMENESFEKLLLFWDQPNFEKAARTEFIHSMVRQIKLGGPIIGLSYEKILSHPLTRKIAPLIEELRTKEMQGISLARTHDCIDLRSLYLTSHGFEILSSSRQGLTCSMKEFEVICGSLSEIGFEIAVEDKRAPLEFGPPPHISSSLANYIFQIVELRARQEND